MPDMSENASSLEEFRRRCLEAVLTDSEHQVEQLCQSLMDTKGRDALTSLLMDTQHFPPLGNGHDFILLHALKDLMDTPLPPSANHITHPGSILESYSRAYKGLFIHLAAAVGRTRIVLKLINMAEMYQLDCIKQFIVIDVNYNTALCLAVQNYHKETVQTILDLLFKCNSSSTEFILRHCAAKTSRRLAYCHNPELVDSIWNFEIKSAEFGYILFSSISLLYYIWCRDVGAVQEFCDDDGLTFSSTVLDPNPFHFATMLYSQQGMTIEELNILDSLRRYSSCNSIRALKIGNHTVINGTTAHFAISSYQLSKLALRKKFPDIPQASDLMNKRKGDENHPPTQWIQQRKDISATQGNEQPIKKRKTNDHPPTQGSKEDEDEPQTKKRKTNDHPPTQGSEEEDDEPQTEKRKTNDHPSTQGSEEEDDEPQTKKRKTNDHPPPHGSEEDDDEPQTKKRKTNKAHPPTQGNEDDDEASWLEGEAGKGHPIFEMLSLLHAVYDVDLTKANWEGKTPLECLPPDADPALVKKLLDFVANDSDTEI